MSVIEMFEVEKLLDKTDRFFRGSNKSQINERVEPEVRAATREYCLQAVSDSEGEELDWFLIFCCAVAFRGGYLTAMEKQCNSSTQS